MKVQLAHDTVKSQHQFHTQSVFHRHPSPLRVPQSLPCPGLRLTEHLMFMREYSMDAISLCPASKATIKAVLPSCKASLAVTCDKAPCCAPATPPGGRAWVGTHAVGEGDVTAGHSQQQPRDLLVAVLAGTHEGRGAVVILHVDIRLAGQQGFDHVYPPVADCQHQGCLPRLGRAKNRRMHRPQGMTPLLWSLPQFLNILMLPPPLFAGRHLHLLKSFPPLGLPSALPRRMWDGVRLRKAGASRALPHPISTRRSFITGH